MNDLHLNLNGFGPMGYLHLRGLCTFPSVLKSLAQISEVHSAAVKQSFDSFTILRPDPGNDQSVLEVVSILPKALLISLELQVDFVCRKVYLICMDK